MTVLVKDITKWSFEADDQGYALYTLTIRVFADGNEGPLTIASAAGLPQWGDPWDYFGEFDEFSTRTPAVRIERASGTRDQGPATQYDLTFTFTNKPLDPTRQRCNDTPIDDPLLEPAKISFDTVQDKEEALYDRFGASITNSAHEVIRGPQNEWDIGRIHISIEHNSPISEAALCFSMLNSVNEDWLWGCPPRTIRLKKVSIKKAYYGQCYLYFVRTFELEVNWRGWDRDILDEATKVLKGHWGSQSVTGTGTGGEAVWVLETIDGLPPDPENPAHFIRAKDRNDENMKIVLNGAGLPATLVQQSLTVVAIFFDEGRLDVRTDTLGPEGDFEVGDRVRLSNVDPSQYDGNYVVDEVVSAHRIYIMAEAGFVQGDSGPYTGTTAKIVNLDQSGSAGSIHVEKYPGADFLQLSLPIDLES